MLITALIRKLVPGLDVIHAESDLGQTVSSVISWGVCWLVHGLRILQEGSGLGQGVGVMYSLHYCLSSISD